MAVHAGHCVHSFHHSIFRIPHDAGESAVSVFGWIKCTFIQTYSPHTIFS
jgi:hypothetical protein